MNAFPIAAGISESAADVIISQADGAGPVAGAKANEFSQLLQQWQIGSNSGENSLAGGEHAAKKTIIAQTVRTAAPETAARSREGEARGHAASIAKLSTSVPDSPTALATTAIPVPAASPRAVDTTVHSAVESLAVPGKATSSPATNRTKTDIGQVLAVTGATEARQSFAAALTNYNSKQLNIIGIGATPAETDPDKLRSDEPPIGKRKMTEATRTDEPQVSTDPKHTNDRLGQDCSVLMSPSAGIPAPAALFGVGIASASMETKATETENQAGPKQVPARHADDANDAAGFSVTSPETALDEVLPISISDTPSSFPTQSTNKVAGPRTIAAPVLSPAAPAGVTSTEPALAPAGRSNWRANAGARAATSAGRIGVNARSENGDGGSATPAFQRDRRDASPRPLPGSVTALEERSRTPHSLLHGAADTTSPKANIGSRQESTPDSGNTSTEQNAGRSAGKGESLGSALHPSTAILQTSAAQKSGAQSNTSPLSAQQNLALQNPARQTFAQAGSALQSAGWESGGPRSSVSAVLPAASASATLPTGAPPPAQSTIAMGANSEPPQAASVRQPLVSSGQLQVGAHGGELKLSVQLPELGKVEVRAVTDRDVTTAHLTTFHHDALQALSAGRAVLEQALRSHDVILGSIDSHARSSHGHNTQGQPGGQQRQSGSHFSAPFTGGARPGLSATITVPTETGPLPFYSSISFRA